MDARPEMSSLLESFSSSHEIMVDSSTASKRPIPTNEGAIRAENLGGETLLN